MEVRSTAALKQFNLEKLAKINLFETDNFFCDIYCLMPGQQQKVHSHKGADKVYFVLEGVGYFTIGNEQREWGSGHAILAPADLPHGVENRTNDQLVLLVFMSPNPNRHATT